MITVLWYGGSSLLDRLIRWFTSSPYTHVAIQFGGVVYEEEARGIAVHSGAQATARAAGARAYRVVPLSASDVARATAWIQRNDHDPYNYSGLVTAALAAKLGIQASLVMNQGYDCSGWAAELLGHLGYVFPKETRDITPGDLARYLGPLHLGPPPVTKG